MAMTKPNGCFNKNKYDYIISTKTRIFLSFLVTGGYLSVSTHNKHHGLIRKDPEKHVSRKRSEIKNNSVLNQTPRKTVDSLCVLAAQLPFLLGYIKLCHTNSPTFWLRCYCTVFFLWSTFGTCCHFQTIPQRGPQRGSSSLLSGNQTCLLEDHAFSSMIFPLTPRYIMDFPIISHTFPWFSHNSPFFSDIFHLWWHVWGGFNKGRRKKLAQAQEGGWHHTMQLAMLKHLGWTLRQLLGFLVGGWPSPCEKY